MDFQQIRDFVNPAVAQATGIEPVENLSMPVPVAYVPVQLVIDGALSLTSENPVQNKVIAVAIQQLDGRITAIEGQFSEGVTEAVNNWLAAHPEATTTVQDGAISYAKLDANLKGEVDQISELKSAINYVRKVTTETIIPDWHLGTISSANGKESSSANNIITARLKCYAGTSISIGTGDGYVMVAKYSLIDGSYIGVLGGWAKAYTLDEDCYCKFLAKNETSSTISDISEVVAKVNFDVYSENVLLPDVKESKENIAVISDYFVVGTNLFDLSTIVDGILAPTNGNITQSSLYFVSDYIPVEINKTYTYQTDTSFGSTTMKRIAVYDSSKTYIGYFQGTVTNEVNVFTVSLSAVGNTVSSSDIKYVRICNIKTKLSGQQYCEGDTLPRYEPYGAKYLESDFRLNETQKQEVQQYISSPLAGKKILYNGDSICESRTNESSLDYNGGAYAKMISDLTGSTYINYAIGGATLVSAVPSGANVQRRLSRDIQYMDDTADLICFDGGINDYSYSVPMGTFSESDYTSELDTTTLCGAMESVIRQSMAKWVGKPICFVLTHKMYNTVYTENNAGYTFAEAHEKLKQICKKYSIPVYDAYEDSGLNGYVYIQRVTFLNASPTGQADGWHPNAAGYKAYYVNHLLKLFESILVSE